MPQNLTPAWRDALGDAADDLHRRYVHRLGNVTLSGYNSELSDDPFSAKRQRLAASNLAGNREIAQHATWGTAEIDERTAALAEQAIRTWTGPSRKSPE